MTGDRGQWPAAVGRAVVDDLWNGRPIQCTTAWIQFEANWPLETTDLAIKSQVFIARTVSRPIGSRARPLGSQSGGIVEYKRQTLSSHLRGLVSEKL